MKRYSLLFLFFVLYTTNIFSQRCATASMQENIFKNDTSAFQNYSEARKYSNSYRSKNSTDELYTIPVVVHVVYNIGAENISDDQIFTQIDVINKDYTRKNSDTTETPIAFTGVAADCNIEFCLASIDPNGIATNGITRTYSDTSLWLLSYADNIKATATGGEDAWPSGQYLNIWVCDLDTGYLGYAYYPGVSYTLDGVVVDYRAFGVGGIAASPYNKGRTLTHEIGHWLGLSHTWGDDGGTCVGDDDISDTPPQADNTFGCPDFPKTDDCSEVYPGIMFMDYMDYTDDACMNLFTTEQAAEMRSALETSRLSILSSPAGCNALIVPSNDPATVSINPNPNDGNFAFLVTNFLGTTMQIDIYNEIGQSVFSKIYPPAMTISDTVTLPRAAKGCYFVRVFNGTYFIFNKFVIY